MLHVAAEIGFWNEVKVQVLARELRQPVGLAGSYVLRFRELVLLRGSADGSVRGYRAAELAAALGFEGSPAKLTKALRAARLLRVRGNVLIYDGWAQTLTGAYQLEKAADAKRKRKERRELSAERHRVQLEQARREATKGGGGAPISNTPVSDVHGTSDGRPRDIWNKEGKKGAPEGGDEAPPGAPQGGETEGASRWEWFENHYPAERLSSPDKCQRYLSELTAEEWELVQWMLRAPKYLRKPPRFWKRSDAWLRQKQFVAAKAAWRKARDEAAKPKPATPKVDEPEQLSPASERFLAIRAELRKSGIRNPLELERLANEQLAKEFPELAAANDGPALTVVQGGAS